MLANGLDTLWHFFFTFFDIFYPFWHSNTVTYSYACRNIVNTIMTNETQFFRKIYVSHFIRNGTKGLRKGYCVRGKLETEQNCNILTPSSIAALLSRYPGLLNREPWGPSSLLGLVLTSSNSSKSLKTLISNFLRHRVI